jgi:hypothetical protein
MQAKAQAATLGVTLAQLIKDALRASLMRCEKVEHRGRVRMITMKGTGMRPGIDLDNSHALLEIMERYPDGCQHPGIRPPRRFRGKILLQQCNN